MPAGLTSSLVRHTRPARPPTTRFQLSLAEWTGPPPARTLSGAERGARHQFRAGRAREHSTVSPSPQQHSSAMSTKMLVAVAACLALASPGEDSIAE